MIMNQIWLQMFAVLIGGSIVKSLVLNSLIWVVIDLAVLAAVYYILQRNPYVDMKHSMFFMGILTVVNILTDIRIIPDILGNIIILGLLLWMIFDNGRRGGGRRPPVIRHRWHK